MWRKASGEPSVCETEEAGSTPARHPNIRRSMTCRVCWEKEGINVDYVILEAKFDMLSVETKTKYQCPKCGYKPPRIGL